MLEPIYPLELDCWKINKDSNSAEYFISAAQGKPEYLNGQVKMLEDQLASLKRFMKEGK